MTTRQAQTFNWQGAIERNRAALLRIVVSLFFMAGLDESATDPIPRRVWRRILRLLRPAESAVRRLIVIAARGIEVAPPKPRPEKPLTGIERLQAEGVLTIREVNLGLARMWSGSEPAEPQKPAPRIPAFALIDPPRRFDKRGWDGLRPFPKDGFELADEDEEVNATGLRRRVLSLKAALDDIDTCARRLARWRARREAGPFPFKRSSPLRLGHPPGHRTQPASAVDDILSECHGLALGAMKAPDTS